MMLRLSILAMAIALVPGCQRRESLTNEPPTEPPRAEPGRPGEPTGASNAQRTQASRRPPAGATCSGRDDCTSDQVCVDQRCRYRQTSVSGEVYASAAEAQAESGDWPGAVATYERAFEAYERSGAPVPPEVACGAAELILRTANDPEARERGARRADLCFRTTVVGDPGRIAVRRALARLRFEGLQVDLYDGDEPATRFFTEPASRPTVDAVQIEVQMPDLEPREPASHAAVREALRSEAGQRAIAECFISDWDRSREQRSASASLGFRFTVELRDRGDWDDYVPNLQIQQTTAGEDGFEPCLARSLPDLFDPNGRSLRGEPWEQSVRITARLQ